MPCCYRYTSSLPHWDCVGRRRALGRKGPDGPSQEREGVRLRDESRMCASALVAAIVRGQAVNVIAALMTAYLVLTGLMTVRPPRRGRAGGMSG